ncbi:MAG: hypothetical protein JRJ87_11370 [Deltaproteobacteria bacterium]|nr:hypothetical protein [Deltaproteobacteria bacterium]
MISLNIIAALASLVSMIPDRSIVSLEGESRVIQVLIRNISEAELSDVRLSVESEFCSATFDPESITSLRSSDRAVYKVTLKKSPKMGKGRVPVVFHLASQHNKRLASVELTIDGRKITRDKDSWIPAGTIKVNRRKPWITKCIYIFLCVVPIGLLLGLGWRYKKKFK